jgi:four helix bundle protein
MPKITSFRDLKSAVSVPSNIAEGSRRKTPGYINHLYIALGSHGELDTQCQLATRRRFLREGDSQRINELIAETGRVMHGLLRSLDPTAWEILIPNPQSLIAN